MMKWTKTDGWWVLCVIGLVLGALSISAFAIMPARHAREPGSGWQRSTLTGSLWCRDKMNPAAGFVTGEIDLLSNTGSRNLLAFGKDSDAQEAAKLLNNRVRVSGVVVQRGETRWLLVDSITLEP